MTSVYLAGPFRAMLALQRCSSDLADLGIDCTSTWLTGQHDGPADAAAEASIEDRLRWASEDFADIDAAGRLIVFTADEAFRITHGRKPVNRGEVFGFGASGGRHIETGYAMAKGYPVIVVGEPENIFQWSGTVVPAWGYALDLMRAVA